MTGVHSVEVEGSEFAGEMGGGLPDLDLGAVSGGDEPALSRQLGSLPSLHSSTHFPSGENLTSRTGFLKLKW